MATLDVYLNLSAGFKTSYLEPVPFSGFFRNCKFRCRIQMSYEQEKTSPGPAHPTLENHNAS